VVAGGDGAPRCEGRAVVLADRVRVDCDGREHDLPFLPPPRPDDPAAGAEAAGTGAITAPMPGKIVKVTVAPGAEVEEHDLLVVLEAMKMEHRIEAPGRGRIGVVHVQPNQLVTAGAALVELVEMD
jgi:biotin carboxyl carrier protein